MTNDKKLNGVFAWLTALTVFVSAFLLFQVQPLISKAILPWFGGTPAVWTTAMMFFQFALLIGYLYAHLIAKRLNPRAQMILHAVLLVAAGLTLPIVLNEDWKPAGTNSLPALQIVTLLAVTVGLPYVLLASTGPLLQVWFGRRLPDASPWRLYALSNLGSLLGLFTFPFFVERTWSSHEQAVIWSWVFVGFAILCGLVSMMSLPKSATDDVDPVANKTPLNNAADSQKPAVSQVLQWLMYPAFASIMLLALTHHLCQDVAVVPFLWVAPLGLYLLSFVICFDSERWYSPAFFSLLTVVAVLLICGIMSANRVSEYLTPEFMKSLGLSSWDEISSNIIVQVAADLLALFGICMVCHGEVVRSKPDVSRLTSFYLTISTGGAIGGLFVGLVCPLIFTDYAELHVGLILAFILSTVVFYEFISTRFKKLIPGIITLAITLVGTVGVAHSQWDQLSGNQYSIRNFFGTLHVKNYLIENDNDATERRLINGRILHGSQIVGDDRRYEPTTYYGWDTGLGLALKILHERGPVKVAAVGLGVGTTAVHAKDGDVFRFYEINPDVIKIAQQQFTYLSDSVAKIEIVEGDARLSMEAEEPQEYDLIAVDAFTSDSIPVHLVTLQAFDVYERHLKTGGVLAFHISNRYLNLEPVLRRICESRTLNMVVCESSESPEAFTHVSSWVLISENTDILENPAIVFSGTVLDEISGGEVSLWTDQFSNLMEVLR